MSAPFTLNWGILATGGVARDFVGDLLRDPSARGTTDVRHRVVAVGSSSSIEKAQEFVRTVSGNNEELVKSVRTYANYQGILGDTDVSIVYIGTPQSHHYRNILDALNAGKHVCCEKPFTINSKQAEHVINVARQKSLFLMEAVWTRFFPITREILHLLHDKNVLGDIKRVWADFSLKVSSGRLYDPELGGGALLDLGIYPVTWAFLTLYRPNEATKPKVKANILMSETAGVDKTTTISMTFEKAKAVATAETSLSARTARPHCIVIQGDKGDLFVEGSCPRPQAYTLALHGEESQRKAFTFDGHGMFWEADACARAIRDGQLEVAECSLQETLDIGRVLDETRAQNGFLFPAPLEELVTQ